MIQAKNKVIDGAKYTVVQLPATPSLKLLHRLARSLGPALLKGYAAADGKKGGLLQAELNFAQLGDAAQLLFEQCDEATFEGIVKQLLDPEVFLVNDKKLGPGDFELHFAGAMLTLLKVLGFALEVNFGDFFAVLASLNAQAMAKKLASETAPSTASTPRSGPSGG